MPGTTFSTQSTPSSHAVWDRRRRRKATGTASAADGVDQPADGQRVGQPALRQHGWRSRTTHSNTKKARHAHSTASTQ